MDKIESLVKRMRWRAFNYLKQQKLDNNIKETLGFRSWKCPPPSSILFHTKKIYQIW